MTKRVGYLLLGMMAGVAGPARPARADSLAGLDAKLQGTGRIGTMAPRSAAHIEAAGPDGGATDRARDPQQAMVRIEDEDAVAGSAARAHRLIGADAEDLERTDGAVADCRVEVVRRRRVVPSKIAAGTVVLRFTIDKSGRVREAEALSAIRTDLEVAACAKRVLSDWTFPKRPRDAEVVVERTYRFSRS